MACPTSAFTMWPVDSALKLSYRRKSHTGIHCFQMMKRYAVEMSTMSFISMKMESLMKSRQSFTFRR
ncbi:hypothetical protein DPMN_134649 [Dreissena polymorpha]|uniref:Uncharacterized protein n=1 Tax=Dreissena polymorpha TaxID=45954 RepID=A0A9D4JC33_DREPO|nr:hypothetical protein DPMN_134649 [Dreissena polymorpha]